MLKSGFTHGADYAISKAALNMAVAQFAAALRPEGFTCVAISPGVVATAGESLYLSCGVVVEG